MATGSNRGGVWVDFDPGIGLPLIDIDDALALVFLVASGVSIVGVSTCFGNTTLPRIHPVAQRLARRLGVPVVARGAASPGDVHTEAVDALASFRGTVLAIAPPTNVAAALRRGASWERLVVLGGTTRRRPNLRLLHTTELNFAVDEHAAAVVLEAGCDLVTMEPCREVWFDEHELGVLPPDLARGARSWLVSSPLRTGRRAFHPWDVLAAAWLTDPDLCDVREGGFRVDSGRLSRGRVRRVEGRGRWLAHIDAAELSRRFRSRVAGCNLA